jgi:hypothetical protein
MTECKMMKTKTKGGFVHKIPYIHTEATGRYSRDFIASGLVPVPSVNSIPLHPIRQRSTQPLVSINLRYAGMLKRKSTSLHEPLHTNAGAERVYWRYNPMF